MLVLFERVVRRNPELASVRMTARPQRKCFLINSMERREVAAGMSDGPWILGALRTDCDIWRRPSLGGLWHVSSLGCSGSGSTWPNVLLDHKHLLSNHVRRWRSQIEFREKSDHNQPGFINPHFPRQIGLHPTICHSLWYGTWQFLWVSFKLWSKNQSFFKIYVCTHYSQCNN